MRLAPLGLAVLVSTPLGIGCDSTAAGHLDDPAGPPRIVRIMVQDAAATGGAPAQRAAAVDLLHTEPPTPCSDTDRCISQFLIASTTPDLTCDTSGHCFDPLAVPASGVPLNGSSNSVRVVFNKLLDSRLIESVALDGNGAPTGKTPYAIMPGLVELLGPDGQPVALPQFWDPTGVPDYTSDLVSNPFGPAVVLPGQLRPKTTYTLRIHPALLKDRQGRGAVGKDGAPLADPYDVAFTTEGMTQNPGLSYPSFAKTPATLARDEVVTLAYYEPFSAMGLLVKGLMVSATGPAGVLPENVEGYFELGKSATMAGCMSGLKPTQLNFVYTAIDAATGKRLPVRWPPGSYTLSFMAPDASGSVSYASPTFAFTVADMDATDPTHTFANHVTPEGCL